MKDCSQNNNKAPWKLVPLTPEYLENEHGVYVNAIKVALSNPKIRNIALSGSYGAGKSSILQKIAEAHGTKVVELSLSTLAPVEPSTITTSVSHATTPTNRIQQEIVKQLLYREEPHKVPGSRFQRIERFRWNRELAIASIIGIVTGVIFLLAGWSEKIFNEFPLLTCFGSWGHFFIWAVTTGIAWGLRYLFHGHLHIGQLSAGSAAITLDKKSASYFDQYLDEIVYFFEVSERDIIIFEDLDRFDDALIFETLRALNTLLNNSPQIKNPIRFIYAIKDSIFDQKKMKQNGITLRENELNIDDPAESEIVRANRTKFFDIIIPVVPFITHRSARNLVALLLQEIDHTISPDLIDLAGRYVPDMRLLKSVCNEFMVFRDRIFSGDGKDLNLSEAELFAMMLYKSTHLNDFESIRIGKSNLDQLYKKSRSLVTENISRVNTEIRRLRSQLNHTDTIPKNSSILGDQLIAHIGRVVKAARYQTERINLSFDGSSIKNETYLKSYDFWITLINSSDEAELRWNNTYNSNQNLRFTRADIAEALDISLDSKYWEQSYRDELEENIKKNLEKISLLRIADMCELAKSPDFLLRESGSDKTFSTIAYDILKDGLAYQLVHAGYINRNFTLYTSTFHGNRVSTAATNFIIHHVERNIMDEHFKLDSADAKAVVRECGKKLLGEPALYNIDILDHLLRTDISTAEIMVKSLIKLNADERRFLQAYLPNGKEYANFIKFFTKETSKALTYLINQVDLDESVRLSIVSSALEALENDMEYQIDATVKKYLKSNYTNFRSLTSESILDIKAKKIASTFSEAKICIPLLEPLSSAVRHAFVEKNLYEINLDNLRVILGSDTNLSLDRIKNTNNAAYQYVLENLESYLSTIKGLAPTICENSEFILVIEDVISEAPDQIGEIIENASDSCGITNLTDVSEKAWPHLAYYKRVLATFNNINSYFQSTHEVDANLAIVLNTAGTILNSELSRTEDKVPLAIAILAAQKHLPSPFLRVQLAVSLKMDEYLNIEYIKPEKGTLFGLLVDEQIIKDDATTYAYLSTTDWPTREKVIQVSNHFKEYVSPALLKGDLAVFLLSDKINDALKFAVIEQADAYVDDGSEQELAQLAQFSIKHGLQLSVRVVEILAAQNVPANEVVILLKPHLETIPIEKLFDILRSIGGVYSELSSLGRDKSKIPDLPPNRALLDTLQQHGIVSTYTPDGSKITVYKKHK